MSKRILLFALFSFIFTAVSFSQSSKDAELADSIKLMDKQWIIEAYSSKDLKDFDRIVADDFLITAGNGKVQNKAEKRAGVAKDYTDPATADPNAVFRIEPESHKVRIFKDTAVSNGYIAENYIWKGTKINNRVYFTNVYLRRKGRWQIVASQFTNVKQS